MARRETSTEDVARERARRPARAPATTPAHADGGGVPEAATRAGAAMPRVMVLRLQQQAGNAAVSRLVRPSVREAPAPAVPGAATAEPVATEQPAGPTAAEPAPSVGIPAPPPGAGAPAATGPAASGGAAPGAPGRAVPALEHRPAPKPPTVAPPARAGSTVDKGAPPAASAAAPAVEAGPPAVAAAAGPAVEAAPAADEGGGGPPTPPPGLGDEELAALDAGSEPGAAAGPETEEAAAAGAEGGGGLAAPEPVGSEPEPVDVAGPEPVDVTTAQPSEAVGGPGGGAEVVGAEPAGAEPAAVEPGPAGGAPEPVAPEAGAAEPEATGPEGGGAEGPVDPGAAQEAVAQGAQAEVEELSAAGPEPAAEGGGGGGGAAIEDRPAPAPPDVSAAPPEQALATVGGLRPTQMAATLGGVEAAASGAVAQEQARLAAAPPTHTPLAGKTQDAPASAQVPGAGAASTAQVGKVTPGPHVPQPAPRPLPPPGPAPAARVAAPALPVAPEGGLTEEGARDLAASIDRMPTHDPSTTVSPGPAPQLRLAGDADPGQVSAQQAHVEEGAAHAQAEGARDAAEPMGEDAVRPTVAVETFEADVGGAPGGGGGPAPAPRGGGAGAGEGGVDDAAVDAVVEDQQGPALRSAATAGAAQMTAARQQHADQERTQRAESAQQVAALEAEHAQAQAAETADLRAGVAGQRAAWRSEQAGLVAGAHAEARAVTADAGATVAAEQSTAQTEAAQAHAQGQAEATEARQEGEREAASARAEGKKESGGGGFFGWLASKATALFDKVKAGISAAFEKARQAVKAAIEKAQQLATAVIEKARQVVVAAIRAAGAALTAIGDRLLAAFPGLRERFRNAIRAAVQRAEATVNRLAEGLKNGVKAALGALGRGLTALLDVMEAGLKAAVSAVAATVNAAINAAKAALAAVGAFLAIAKDVAANPGAWLSNLGAAVVDGIRNHLWKALKTAVSQWFNDKVEQVLGLGRAVWNLLTKGGLSIAKIGAMAWEGIKSAIPPALIGLLVEKLVSMIVPAAGAVLAIIQGLQAAWGTVSRILQAIDAFIAFLKAVKTGNGGPAFANVLSAAAITVIDFVSNWLLARLAKGASKVAGKIREIAKKIGAALKKVAKKIGGALKKLGKKIGAKFKAIGDKFKAWREKRRQRKEAKKSPEQRADEQRKKQERLDKAVQAITPLVTSLVQRGVSSLRLKAQLLWWRVRYRLTRLEVVHEGDTIGVRATVNPSADVIRNVMLANRALVHRRLRDVRPEVERDPRVQAALAKLRESRAASFTPGTPKTDDQAATMPRSQVEHEPGAVGSAAAAVDVATGSKVGTAPGAIVRPPGTIEVHQFGGGELVRESQDPKYKKHGGDKPGMILVDVDPHRYEDMKNQWGDAGPALGQAMIDVQAGRGIQPGTLPSNITAEQAAGAARLFQVEQGRDDAAFATLPMVASLMAQGKMEAAEGLLHQMSPEGAMKISRAAQKQAEREKRAAQAVAAGEKPAARDLKPPYRPGSTMETDVTRFLERTMETAAKWLEERSLVDPYCFQTEERFLRFLKKDLTDYVVQHLLEGTMHPTSGDGGSAE